MVDLDRQLESYARYLDEVIEPVDAVSVIAPHERRRTRWMKVAAAVAAALLVLAVFLPLVLFRNGAEPADETTTTSLPSSTTTMASPTTTEAMPTTEATPPTTEAPPVEEAAIGWEPVLVAGPDHLFFTRVASDGRRIVAVSAESDTADASVWGSDDGREWQKMDPSNIGGADPFEGVLIAGPDGFRVVGPQDVTPEETQGVTEVSAVATNDEVWVAVGHHELDGRVWLSPDAVSWLRVDDDTFSGASLLDVVGGGPGFVAVGSFHGLGQGGDERAAVWVSDDGRSWRLVESEAVATETRLGSAFVDPSDGSIIAFGVHSVWRSIDGSDWTVIHDRDLLVWASQPDPAVDAVWLGDNIVAGGGDGWPWTSPDRGVSWVRPDPDDTVFGVSGLRALTEHRGMVIAVGGEMDARVNQIDPTAPWADPDTGVIWIGLEPGWTCDRRVTEGGAAWNLGEKVDADGDGNAGEYRVDGYGGCVDIDPADAGLREWTVTWEGIPGQDPIQGLQLVFEQGVHGARFAQTIVTDPTGSWVVTVDPSGTPFAFVSMPHVDDSWESLTITLFPGPVEP